MRMLMTKGLITAAGALLASFGAARADTPIELKGTFRECLGAATGRNYDITNKTGEPIHDFTVTIEKEGGGDPGAKITDLDCSDGSDPDFDVDDNLDGKLEGGVESDNTDSSAGTTTR